MFTTKGLEEELVFVFCSGVITQCFILKINVVVLVREFLSALCWSLASGLTPLLEKRLGDYQSIHPLLAVSLWPKLVIHRTTFECSKTLEIIYHIFWKPKSYRLVYPKVVFIISQGCFFLTLQFFMALSVILSLMISYNSFLSVLLSAF